MSSFSHFRDVRKMVDPHLAGEQLLHQALLLGFEGVELLAEQINLPFDCVQRNSDSSLFFERWVRQPDSLEVAVANLFAITNSDHRYTKSLNKFVGLEIMPKKAVLMGLLGFNTV